MIDKTAVKKIRRERRKLRSKKNIHGTADRPRLVVYRSNSYLYAQIVDDDKGHTLCAGSTLKMGTVINKEVAGKFGAEFGKLASEKGITTVIFDRNSFLYHGKIKAFADAVRSCGIKF